MYKRRKPFRRSLVERVVVRTVDGREDVFEVPIQRTYWPASTVPWEAVGTRGIGAYTFGSVVTQDVFEYHPPKPPAPVACASCHGVVEPGAEADTCQVCGERYHRRGCGVSTLYSFICNRCRRERRMPAGWEDY